MGKKDREFCIKILCAIYMAVCLFGFSAEQANAEGYYLQKEAEEISEIRESSLYAQSAVLMDATSGRVLYEKNSTEILPMASTTKIMTLIVALEEGNLSDIVTVSAYAAGMPDVQLNIREGEQYYLKDLLYSLMLESHNDSAVAIAEGIAGSVEAFAQKMNQKAKEIGCKNTTFITPNGLDATATLTGKDGSEKQIMHSTTAEDLAGIMSYCITESPCKEEFLAITQTPSYSFSDCSKNRTFTCRNHNSFLYMMEGAISGKTGFTGKAGYCYVGALKRDERIFVVALLACGWPNNRTYKWKDTKKLMEYGIENYRFSYFEDAAEDIPKYGRILVENGQTEQIGQSAYADWKVVEERKKEHNKGDGLLLRKDEKITVNRKVREVLSAPVKKGETAGYIQYLINGDVYREDKIIIQNDVDQINYAWCLKKTLQRFWLF